MQVNENVSELNSRVVSPINSPQKEEAKRAVGEEREQEENIVEEEKHRLY